MKITPYRIKKGICYLRHYGPRAFWNRLLDKLEPEEVPYGPWFEQHKAGVQDLNAQSKREKTLSNRPLISIVVPCYCTPDRKSVV